MKKSAARSGVGKSPARLHVTIWAQTGRAHVKFLQAKLKAAHKMLSPSLGNLSVALVGEESMRDLHSKYMQKPNATDVLTFEMGHDPRGRITAGEVVICVPVAQRQAAMHIAQNPAQDMPLRRLRAIQKKHDPVARELLLYALHGMLHLCGFDDKTEAGFQVMHRKEDQILTRLGVGPVFRQKRQSSTGRNKKSGAG